LLAAGFLVSGAVLVASKFSAERQDTISIPAALLVGVMQGLSIIPSLSRSGLTIAALLLLGVKREVAFKFSFLLSVPAIIGALGLTLYQEQNALSLASIGSLDILVSLAVTVAISFLALKLLWKTLKAQKFYLFAVYCFAIGVLLLTLVSIGL
jgi:undecaprenyl-diphosphatase